MNEYEKLVQRIPQLSPKENFVETVVFQIKGEMRVKIWRRFVVGSFFALASLFALIPAIRELYSTVSRSGSLEIISLAFSDFGTVTTYWKEFLLSFVESVPFIPFVSVVASVLVLLVSVRSLSEMPKKSFRLFFNR